MEIEWKEPDSKIYEEILLFANKKYKTIKTTTNIVGIIVTLFIELFPLGILLRCNSFSEHLRAIICIVFIAAFGYCICAIFKNYTKQIYNDIKNNKINITDVIVRDKKQVQNNSIEYYVTVQFQNQQLKELRVDDAIYKRIGLGSLLIAIKYSYDEGFYDQYDLILNPYTISEND